MNWNHDWSCADRQMERAGHGFNHRYEMVGMHLPEVNTREGTNQPGQRLPLA